MSDEPFVPPQPPLMNAARARDIARAYKWLADNLEDVPAEARRAERQSWWWLAFATALAQMPPEDAP
jgi:hypothetical protein